MFSKWLEKDQFHCSKFNSRPLVHNEIDSERVHSFRDLECIVVIVSLNTRTVERWVDIALVLAQQLPLDPRTLDVHIYLPTYFYRHHYLARLQFSSYGATTSMMLIPRHCS